MKTIRTPQAAILCAALVCLSGCWLGGNTRSNVRPRSVSPAAPIQPELQPPVVEPSVPFPSGGSYPPSLDGPTFDGPAFPQSSKLPPAATPGFDRPRYTHDALDNSPSNYAGTDLPPVVLDGPVAHGPSDSIRNTASRIGYIELPPAP